MNKFVKEALDELIKNLNSEKYEKAIREFYNKKVVKIDKLQLDEETFVSYVKAYSIKRFLDPDIDTEKKRDIQYDAYAGNINIDDIVDVLFIVEKKPFMNSDYKVIKEPTQVDEELEKIKRIVKTCNLQKTLDK